MAPRMMLATGWLVFAALLVSAAAQVLPTLSPSASAPSASAPSASTPSASSPSASVPSAPTPSPPVAAAPALAPSPSNTSLVFLNPRCDCCTGVPADAIPGSGRCTFQCLPFSTLCTGAWTARRLQAPGLAAGQCANCPNPNATVAAPPGAVNNPGGPSAAANLSAIFVSNPNCQICAQGQNLGPSPAPGSGSCQVLCANNCCTGVWSVGSASGTVSGACAACKGAPPARSPSWLPRGPGAWAGALLVLLWPALALV